MEGLGRLLQASIGMKGIGCMGLGWDGCEGPLVDEGVSEMIWMD